ncbi:MAG: hypothetical protein AAF585_05665 [Verrucomicrobiota bacterium]
MNSAAQKALQAAQGYLELDMPRDAAAELATIPELEHDRVEIVEMKALIALKLDDWEAGLEAASKLCELQPSRPSGFIHTAYCLHELGRTAEARETLLMGPASLRDEATFYYNLACYNARLDEDEEALQLLDRAFEMDAKLREMARTDPDLQSLNLG